MIKFLDLKKINERFRRELDAATKRVLDSGWYLLGKEVEQFEKDFSAYCGVKHNSRQHQRPVQGTCDNPPRHRKTSAVTHQDAFA